MGAQAGDLQVREVLANAVALPEYLGHGSRDGGCGRIEDEIFMDAPRQISDCIEDRACWDEGSSGVVAEFIRNWDEWRWVGKFVGFERVAGVIVAAARTDGFPRGCFQGFGDKGGADSDAAAGLNKELLMRCLHADEVSGIAEVIAMDAHGSRLWGNREIVSQTVLLMIVPRSESKQVMRNGHVSRVLIGGAVRDFVKELSHS